MNTDRTTPPENSRSTATDTQDGAHPEGERPGAGVHGERVPQIADRSPHVEKIARKGLSAEHLAKLAAGRAAAAEKRRLKAEKRAARGKGKVAPAGGAIEAWVAKQATLGGDEKLQGQNPQLTVPPEERPEGGTTLTREQALKIQEAHKLGVPLPEGLIEQAKAVLAPKPLGPGEIDYEKLADLVAARLRGPQREPVSSGRGVPIESNIILYPPVTRDDRGMPVNNEAHPVDPHRIARGSRLERIMKQLTYPPDREGQVAAMVTANMAPSWGEGNQEVGDSPYPPAPEAALVAYMQEYCLGLRPELPKVRLEPKYNLAPKAAGAK